VTPAVPSRPGSARPRWQYVARQALWAAVDLVLPPRCGGCEREGHSFCASCVDTLHLISAPVCKWCGYPAPQTGACVNCRSRPRSALAGIRSVAFFEGPLQNALHRLKYKRDVILADTLARLLARAWDPAEVPGEVVVPVPLSAERLRERGYNQAGLLARGFAELRHLRYAPEALRKQRHTVSQVGLKAEQRLANVQDAFRAQPGAVAGRAVILVDDVCTTGATLIAGAEALAGAGAKSVWGFTLGRAR
jgi:ComF family protein